MAKLVDSGNNQYGIAGSFTWAASETQDEFEEFPFFHNLWIHLGVDRTSGSMVPEIQIYMNDQWYYFYGVQNGVGLSTSAAAININSGAVDNRVSRANVMQGNPVPFMPPIPARIFFDQVNFVGTVTYEVRW